MIKHNCLALWRQWKHWALGFLNPLFLLSWIPNNTWTFFETERKTRLKAMIFQPNQKKKQISMNTNCLIPYSGEFKISSIVDLSLHFNELHSSTRNSPPPCPPGQAISVALFFAHWGTGQVHHWKELKIFPCYMSPWHFATLLASLKTVH